MGMMLLWGMIGQQCCSVPLATADMIYTMIDHDR
jgi:hypothetical protein